MNEKENDMDIAKQADKHYLHMKFHRWLGESGITFFADLYRKHGSLLAVLQDGPIPHPVHFREGMQVRNWMRENTDIPEACLDDEWEGFVIEALGLNQQEAA